MSELQNDIINYRSAELRKVLTTGDDLSTYKIKLVSPAEESTKYLNIHRDELLQIAAILLHGEDMPSE